MQLPGLLPVPVPLPTQVSPCSSCHQGPGAMSQNGDHARLPPSVGALTQTGPNGKYPKKDKVQAPFRSVTRSAHLGAPAAPAAPVPGMLKAALRFARSSQPSLTLFSLTVF